MSKKIEAEEVNSRRKLLVSVAGVAAGAGLLDHRLPIEQAETAKAHRG